MGDNGIGQGEARVPLRNRDGTFRGGEEHQFWVGDRASIHTVHGRLLRARGRAAEHNCECGKQAHDWSQEKGTSGYDLFSDYVPRCRGCHVAYDGISRGSRNGQSKLHEDDIPVIRKMLREGKTRTQVAERFGVTPQLISKIKTGVVWSHVK